MSSFLGEYSRKLDAKGRLSLPADFRKDLSEDLIVTPSPTNECLYVFEADAFTQWVDSLFASQGGFDSSKTVMVAQRKVLNSRAQKSELDGSGRISLTANVRELADLDKDVLIIGDTDHFEIWNEERWAQFLAKTDLSSLFN